MDRHDGEGEMEKEREEREGGEEREEREPPGPDEPKLRKYEKDRIAEHVIGHVIGGAIIGVMAWFWTQTPIGFVMTVIWGAGVYWWNKSPKVQGWTRRRRIRLGVTITAAYWTFAFLVM